MRLLERLGRDRHHEALDAEIEEDLAALDRALAGEDEPRDAQIAELTRELREERDEPRAFFAAELDRWADSGFERSARPGRPGRSPRDRLAGLSPRRLIAPAGALAALVIVAGIAISQSETDPGGGPVTPSIVPDGDAPSTTPVPEGGPGAPESSSPQLDFRQEGGGAKAVPPSERKIAKAADLVLATGPEDVREVSDGVNAVVNRYRGIVLSSSVQTGEDGATGARFSLRLPARNLQPALADLSELAHVRSRSESTEDVTARFITARERIDELTASRERLLDRLAAADTDDDARAIRRELRAVSSQLSAARAELAGARERVRFVPLTVSVVVDEDAGGDGQWGIDEALDDAGQVLSAAAGVLIVAGAVLLPLALVGAILIAALRFRVVRGRERALDE